MNLKELDYFNRKLKIGQAYRIAKFICEPVNPWQQTINIKTTLKFGLATTFDTISAATFPCHYFDFVTYNQLESRTPLEDENSKMQFPILIDYIGCLRSVGQLKEKGEANKSQTVWRKLEIENLNGNVIEFTMWDEMAKKFEDAKLDTMQQPIIIAISSCSVSKYRDYQLSATPATYYYLNPNIPEAEQSRAEYTARYQMNPPLKICKTPYKDELLEMKRNRFPLKTLLRQNPDSYKAVRFTSDAKITSIDMDKNWYYTSCNKCSRKVTEQDNVYSCLDNGKQEKPFYRYNFKGLITDPSATAPITFFTPAANDVVGYTCEQLVENHSPANPKQMPAEIAIVKGQQHVFQFHFNTTGSKTDFILEAVFTNKKNTQETTSMSIATTPQTTQSL